jgi:hypothetical protein
MQVAINDFARRQTAESNFSHYEGSFDALCELVARNLDSKVILVDDDDGQVIKVTLPGKGFFSAVTQATPEMSFVGRYEQRDDFEYPYINVRAVAGSKVPANETDIILYSHAKLAVKNEHSTDAAWEIVSINAKRTTKEEPLHPVTMMRNQKNYSGGTRAKYTPEQWADAVEYWLGGGPNPPFVMLDC